MAKHKIDQSNYRLKWRLYVTFARMFSNVNFSNYPNRENIKNELTQLAKIFAILDIGMESCNLIPATRPVMIRVSIRLDIQHHDKVVPIVVSVFLHDLYPLKSPLVMVKPPQPHFNIRVGESIKSDGHVNLPSLTSWNHLQSNLNVILLDLKNWLTVEFPFSQPEIHSQDSKSLIGKSNPSKPPVDPKALREAAQKVVYGVNSSFSYPGGSGQGIPRTFPVQQPIQGPTTHLASTWAPSPMPTYQSTIFNKDQPVARQALLPPSSSITGMKAPVDTLNVSASTFDFSPVSNTTVESYLREIKLDTKRHVVVEKYDRMLADHTSFLAHNLEYLEGEATELYNRKNFLAHLITEITAQTENTKIEYEMQNKYNEKFQAVIKKLVYNETHGIAFDNTIDTTLPLYKQLVTLFLEEQTNDDAIFFLQMALGKSVIDVEMFLKKVRELSRRQFMLKATMEKCRETTGNKT